MPDDPAAGVDGVVDVVGVIEGVVDGLLDAVGVVAVLVGLVDGAVALAPAVGVAVTPVAGATGAAPPAAPTGVVAGAASPPQAAARRNGSKVNDRRIIGASITGLSRSLAQRATEHSIHTVAGLLNY